MNKIINKRNGLLLIITGIILFIIKGITNEYIDENGILQEHFFLIILGYIFILIGLIIIVLSVINKRRKK